MPRPFTSETGRLDELKNLGLLDARPEARFERIVRLSEAVLGAPLALVSVTDHGNPVAGSVEPPEPGDDVAALAPVLVAEVGCSTIVPDARLDPRLHDHPYVTGSAGVRFVATRALSSPDGYEVGALCAVGTEPRWLTPEQVLALDDLTSMVEEELAREHHEGLISGLDFRERETSAILSALAEGLVVQGPEGEFIDWNPASERLLGFDDAATAGRLYLDPAWRAIRPDGSAWPPEEFPSRLTLATGEPVDAVRMGIHRPDGSLVWLDVNTRPIWGPHGEQRVLTAFMDVTDRHDLQQALAASEELARRSLDTLEQGVILVDSEGSVLRINPAAERLLGARGSDLAEMWVSEAWRAHDEHWQPLPDDRRILLRALLGEAVEEEIVGWIRPDGRRVLFRMSCALDADGRGGVLVTITDVTRERAMISDLTRFQYLFENANDIVVVVGADGQVRYASPSTTRVLGYPHGFRHPQGIFGIVHPEDHLAALAEFDRLVDGTGGAEPFTLRVRHHGGDWRHLECVGVNLLHEPDVGGVVLTCRDTTDRELLTQQLAHMAGHDPLTDLPNRSVLGPQLDQALARSDRHEVYVGICFIDLDDFKAINDHHGHAAGDEVIVEVARRIRSSIRVVDTAVRVGGDEFVVILDPVSDVRSALTAARRIRDVIADPPIRRGADVVGASVGVAVNERGEEPSSLLVRADAALYRAKASRSGEVVAAVDPADPRAAVDHAGHRGSGRPGLFA